MFDDYDTSGEIAKASMSYLKEIPPHFERNNAQFFIGLVALANIRRGKRGFGRIAKRMICLFRRLAKTSPENCLDKLSLLLAEQASVRGQNDVAWQHYVCAMSAAKAQGLTNVHARSNELAAKHLVRIGDLERAKHYFAVACDVYSDWGAVAKVKQLQAEVATLFASNHSAN
jgi:sigma-B regulation protein RsbU (phosphoserine phosphatase)